MQAPKSVQSRGVRHTSPSHAFSPGHLIARLALSDGFTLPSSGQVSKEGAGCHLSAAHGSAVRSTG